MKTNLISKAVVMLAVVMASVMNFSASASNPNQYVKNEEMTGELITARTIFKNEDSSQEAWVPYFKMDVSYTNSEVELSYARWNSKSNAYDSNIQKSFYELNDADATLMLASTK